MGDREKESWCGGCGGAINTQTHLSVRGEGERDSSACSLRGDTLAQTEEDRG